MLADFVQTAKRAIAKSGNTASALQLVGDQSRLKWHRLLGNAPSNTEREVRMADDISVRYRLNRGDLWSLREVLLHECYTLHFPLPRFLLVDLGGNIGLTSVWMSRRYDVAAVISVEANPANAALVRKNFQLNNIPGVVEEAAIGPQDGEAFFSDLDDSNFGHVSASGRRVRMISMDTVLSRMEREFSHLPGFAQLPIVVKMDIEGGEESLLAANTDWLSRVHAIIAEFHPDVIDYAACVERLKALGFAYHPPGSLGKDSMDFFIRG